MFILISYGRNLGYHKKAPKNVYNNDSIDCNHRNNQRNIGICRKNKQQYFINRFKLNHILLFCENYY